jgi:ABC-2 type transport system ATP-binding protein
MLQVRRVSKRFGTTQALSELSLSVPAGQVCGFVGQNGAGKTTTMRIVLGVLEPDGGEVLWQGAPVDAHVRRRTGYMPEERGLYPKMRVGDQLRYLGRLHGLDAAQASAATDALLADLGVADRAGDRLEALSLGNQQRVQLAAALVHEPDLLVLDEPFSGLDPVGVEVLAGVLRARVDRGVPVLFSSHQLELVERLCDTVAIIRAGSIVADGTVEQLRTGDRARRLRVVVDGPAPDWPPGVRVLGGGLVELSAGVDDQAVLDAARRAGPVREFTPVRPSLADLFREVVAA